MAIAGHVSRAMLSRYAHIRTEAKRRALEAIATKPGVVAGKGSAEATALKGKHFHMHPPQKSPQIHIDAK